MSRARFSMVPWWVLDKAAAGDIPPGAIVTYAAVAKYVNHKTGRGAWPRNRTLQADTGFSERTIRDHLRALEGIGAIVTEARFAEHGRQTTNLVIIVSDEPTAPPGEVLPGAATGSQSPPPPGSQSPPYELEPISNESAAAEPSVVVPPPDLTTQLTSAPTEQSIPNTESSERNKPLPLARRRQLMNAGVTVESGPVWEQAWLTVTSMQWPDGLEMEAANYPDEHLAQHVFQSLERGFALSPSRWVQFYIADRQVQIKHALARIEQEARMAEDPAEREARQNRHLPPDRSQEYPAPTTQAGVQQ